MREFKFRAYNKKRKEMEYFTDLYWFEENYVKENGDNGWEVMWCIGLTDKNNVEIYEGDIVKITGHWDSNMLLVQAVEYSGASFVPFDDSDWGWDSEECEVIGNKYENPELLKQ